MIARTHWPPPSVPNAPTILLAPATFLLLLLVDQQITTLLKLPLHYLYLGYRGQRPQRLYSEHLTSVFSALEAS